MELKSNSTSSYGSSATIFKTFKNESIKTNGDIQKNGSNTENKNIPTYSQVVEKKDEFIVPKKHVQYEPVVMVPQISPAGKAALEINKE